MGKIKDNKITRSFSGQYGDLVFRRVGNQTFFARKGVNTKPPSPAQRERRSLFAEAQNYAAQVLEEPGYSEWYSIVAKVNGLRSAQIAAVKDYMSRPEIESVITKGYQGNPGDVIHIRPKMLLKIEKMEVTIYHSGRSVLESGPAIKHELNWKYHATVHNPGIEASQVVVVAYDRLGKSCTAVGHLYL